MLEHPVMGPFAIILLMTLVIAVPLYFIASTAAICVSFAGQIIALSWVIGNVAWDMFRKYRNGH